MAAPPTPTASVATSAPQGCGDVGWFSYLTFGWINPLVDIGVDRQVALRDTPPLAPRDDPLLNTRKLLTPFEQAERSGRAHPLLKAVLYAFWPEIALMQVLSVMGHFFGLLSPILLKKVLVFQEEQGETKVLTTEEVNAGFQAVAALICLGLFMIFFSSQVSLFQKRLTLRISNALRGVVLLRCIQGNGGAGASAPAVYNVVSFDVGPNIAIIWIILGLWLFPIQFISTLAVLFRQVSWAVVPGVVTIIGVKVLCFVLLCADGYLRDWLLHAKDVRLSRCDEGFNNIRTLHMLGWVGPFEERIAEARRVELRMQNYRLWVTKMVAAIDYSLGNIVTLVILSYYVYYSGGQLKASVALPVIALASSLAGPFGQFPVWAQQYLIWKSAYSRVNSYMGVDSSGVTRRALPTGGGRLPESSASAASRRADVEGGVAASLRGCTFSWESPDGDNCRAGDADSRERGAGTEEEEQPLLAGNDAFMLREVDLEFRGGEVVVLVATEGEGKSSLLRAMLGEMQVIAGAVDSPACQRLSAESAEGVGLGIVPSSVAEARDANRLVGDGHGEVLGGNVVVTLRESELAVPFLAQSATLFTGSIRSNVLFGLHYDADLYDKVLVACNLAPDLATMPLGDLSDVAQGGATLSGGQRQRVGLARAVYSAALLARKATTAPPLVLLDEPFCSLDRRVATAVCEALFAESTGILRGCAVVVATADPWWVDFIGGRSASASNTGLARLVVLRGGRIVASGSTTELSGSGYPELGSLGTRSRGEGGAPTEQAPFQPSDSTAPVEQANPQDEGGVEEPPPVSPPSQKPPREEYTQTDFTEAQKEAMTIVKEEHRDKGSVGANTYDAYFSAVGYRMLFALSLALAGIMVFQNLCALLIAYWTSDDKKSTVMYRWARAFKDHPPEGPNELLVIYATFVVCFMLSNFLGHGLEIVGGIRAARLIFGEALRGTLAKPWQWWDANPTGRVLNRFSEDVEIMDAAITNIMGVIFGAVLFFVGHSFILFVSNPVSLCLLPFIAMGLEFYARYYRETIRELQRIWLVCMGSVYQEMAEAIVGKSTVNAFDAVGSVFTRSMIALDNFQRVDFSKSSLMMWLSLRMSLLGYIIGVFSKLYPIFQYYGYMKPQEAALVGFSIQYSTETVGIIQQFIQNYSDLEMQLISIERLREYAREWAPRTSLRLRRSESTLVVVGGRGLNLERVTVRYHTGLPPALHDVSLNFAPGEVTAIKGRTGAGKSSLLLSILQLVPYAGRVVIDGKDIADVDPRIVRCRLVGIVPQQPVIFVGDLRWNLDPKGRYKDSQLWAALEVVSLAQVCRQHPQGLQAMLSYGIGNDDGCEAGDSGDEPSDINRGGILTLSQGQQQMVCTARALLRQPRVVLLDEVTSCLPEEAADALVARLLQHFRSYSAVVLMVTHQESFLSACDRVVSMAAGQVAEDARVGPFGATAVHAI